MKIEFYDKDNNVLDDLYDEKAKDIVNTFYEKNNRGMYNSISTRQLRRVYDEVKHFEALLNQKKMQNWHELYPLIKMIKAKVTYNTSRVISKEHWNKNVYQSFKDFIVYSISNIRKDKPEDFFVFTKLFEAVYGFYYGICVEKNLKIDK
ncbi:MAG: type III-A CRISPR-associated protein Csm2 [Spirochaetota bacterium]|nr:type III-A CRISPR-associated protein Csm2 [Spirochaetota bacterium]